MQIGSNRRTNLKILVSGSREVEQLLPMPNCIDSMEMMFKSLQAEETAIAERSILPLSEGRGELIIMPSLQRNVLSAKVMTIFNGNANTSFETIQGAVLIFEVENGRLLGILDSSRLTAIRTAAVSALATKLLARSDATSLAMLGSGAQAAAHLEAISLARNISRVRIWSRNQAHAKRLANKASGSDVRSVDSVRDAVKEADIVCTATSSPVPILARDWLCDGSHINAIGAYSETTRELDTNTVKDSRLFVDSRKAALKEAGDYLIPKKEGAITDKHIIGELGELVSGRVKGRTSDDEITLFKSVGLAVEDTAAAWSLYQNAKNESKGTWIEFGSEREVEN